MGKPKKTKTEASEGKIDNKESIQAKDQIPARRSERTASKLVDSDKDFVQTSNQVKKKAKRVDTIQTVSSSASTEILDDLSDPKTTSVKKNNKKRILTTTTNESNDTHHQDSTEINGHATEGLASSTTTGEGNLNRRETNVHRCQFIDFKPEAIEAMAGNGAILAIGRASGEIEIWRRNESSLQQENVIIPGTRSQGLRCLTWSEHRLFGGNLDGTLFEIDFKTQTQISSESGGGGGIWGMDTNKEMIATACEDGKVRLYLSKTSSSGLEYYRTLSGGSSSRLLCIKFHGNDPSNFVFASGMDGIIRKWNIKQKRIVEQIPVPCFARSLTVWCLDTFDNSLACGDSLGRVHIWGDSDGGTPQTFSEHRADVLSITFSKSGDSLFASGVDSRVAAFRIDPHKNGKWIYAYSHRSHTHDVRSLAIFNSDGMDEILCSGGIDSQLCWYPTKSFERCRPKKESIYRQRVCVSISSNQLILVMHTLKLEIWHVTTGQQKRAHLASLNFDDDTSLRCSAISKNGKYIACGDDSRGLSLFSIDFNEKDEEISLTKLSSTKVNETPFSLIFGVSDSTLIVSTTQFSLFILDIVEDTVIRCFHNQGLLQSLNVSLDGQWLAGINGDDDVQIYNLDLMRHHVTFPKNLFGESSRHAAISFTPNSSNILIVTRLDGSIYSCLIEEKQMDWTLKLPSHVSEKIIGITFNPGEKDAIILWSWAYIVVLNPPNPSITPPRVLRKIKPIIHAAFIGSDDLFLIEAPYVNTLKHLPDVVDRERYGT